MDRTRDRRTKHTFWIDDRVVDQFGPIFKQYPFGPAVLSVYAILARRADREGESWEKVKPMATLAGMSERTFQRCIRLLELLGLLEVQSCFFENSSVQTSNLYTLLTPPDAPPLVDPDPMNWPLPDRPIVYVTRGASRRHVADSRPGAATGCLFDTPPGVDSTPTPRRMDTPRVSIRHPLEGMPMEGITRKEGSPTSFVIAEVGLSSRQVWAAALAELARRGDVSAGEIDTWLRPAALIGREGQALILEAPNAVARDRIARRLGPAVRDALARTLGTAVELTVVVGRT
jgi:hypothetical protein